MKKLLWVGDAGVPSGFARATHETLNVLRETYDVSVLGMNFQGDSIPGAYPYTIYAAAAGGDAFGVGRIAFITEKVQPDLIVLQNDPWNIPHYTRRIKKHFPNIPMVGAIAVDGKNCRGSAMNDLSLGIFWTNFGLAEARAGGFTPPGAVIPLGVDLENYMRVEKIPARRRIGLPEEFDNAYIVGNVNRNQPRKRLDLTIRYFCTWIKNSNIKDAYLYLHVAPTGDTTGFDVTQLMLYYGCGEYLILREPLTFYGDSEEYMRDTYNSFDAQLTTTQGEGFGLTTFEGAACGVLQIFPKWSALEEFFGDECGYGVPCTSTSVTDKGINVIGGVMDEKLAIEALAYSYEFRDQRHLKDALCNQLKRVHEDRFRWRTVGESFRDALKEVV